MKCSYCNHEPVSTSGQINGVDLAWCGECFSKYVQNDILPPSLETDYSRSIVLRKRLDKIEREVSLIRRMFYDII